MKKFNIKTVLWGGGNGVESSGDEVLDTLRHSEGNNVFVPEESQSWCNGRGYFANAQYDELLFSNSSPQRGEEAILSEQERTLGVQVRSKINSEKSFSNELLCKKDNSTEINNQLDCFGSKEPHNDDNSRYSRHSECNEESQSRENITNNAILRGLNNCSPQNDRKIAFTLAEVLITLGIIGVVAAITIPTVINKYQSYVLKQQFRKAYSTLYNAIKLVQKDEPVACWYWENRPYETIECTARNEYGTCIKWAMPNNQPTPSDYSGYFSDCRKFYENLRTTMKAVKYCPNNALKNGCITDNYRGMDKVNLEKNPDVAQDPEQSFSDSKMKNRYPAFITSDGVVYMYWGISNTPFFMFDINGHKGPNKWGYDIFDFSLKGNPNDGITKIRATYGYIEKGGKNINKMIQEF